MPTPANPQQPFGRDRLIVALDVPTATDALAIVDELGDAVTFYKVGLELFTAAGMPLVRELRGMGKQVFLDLKLYDIGETVKRTVAVVASEQVSFLTVHGENQVMRAAIEGRGTSQLQLLAVTVLTSLSADDLEAMGLGRDVAKVALARAANAAQVGCDGVITSAQEAAAIRSIVGREVLIVTPGVRPAGADVQDQKRVAAPATAIGNGADYLVVGRPITQQPDRRQAANAILKEMQAAFDAAARIQHF